MKTTIDIADDLLRQAKQVSRERAVTLRELVSEGLMHVIGKKEANPAFHVKAVTFGGKGLSPEFQRASWGGVRGAIYEGHGS